MERVAVAEADWLISPSAYMLQWMWLQGWTLPQQAAVQVNMLPSAAPATPEQDSAAAGIALREIVFFGRLEARKGLLLFLDALLIFFAVASASSSSPSASSSSPSSVSARLSGLNVSFLGRDTRLPGGDWASDVITRRCASMQQSFRLQFSCRVLSGLSHTAAVQHLRRDALSPPLAVIASPVDNSPFTVLECLAYAVPFLAAAVGGIPELLRQADDGPLPDASHPALFQPTPRHLADKLLLAFTAGIARPQVRTLEEAERRWQVWHLLVTARSPPPPPVAAVASAPVVDVCVLYPDSLSKLRKLSRIILSQQQAGVAFRIRLVVVAVSPLPDALRTQASSPVQPSQREVQAALADLLQPSWPALRLLSLPFAASSSVVSYWQWAAAQLDGDFLLFLDRRDTLNSATALATLLQVADTAQADVVSAMRYHVVSATALLHLGCGELLGVLGASSNCYSSRNLLMRRRSVLSSLAADSGFRHDDDVWQWQMHSELRGLNFQLVPLLLFATDVVHIDAAQPANSSGGATDLHAALSGLTRWTDSAPDGDDGPSTWSGVQQLYSVRAAVRCPLLPVSVISSALVAGHTVKEFQALARALRSSEEEREKERQQTQPQQPLAVQDAPQQ